MKDNRIAIRLFAETPDEAEATNVANTIRAKVIEYGLISREWTNRYWKISEYFELFLDLEPHANVQSTFQRVLDVLATGWTVHRFPTGGDWAVWNPSDSAVFVLPIIRWANVECYQAG